MKLTPKQYDQIKDVLPVQRGNVGVENIDFLNAILYVAENEADGDDQNETKVECQTSKTMGASRK